MVLPSTTLELFVAARTVESGLGWVVVVVLACGVSRARVGGMIGSVGCCNLTARVPTCYSGLVGDVGLRHVG